MAGATTPTQCNNVSGPFLLFSELFGQWWQHLHAAISAPIGSDVEVEGLLTWRIVGTCWSYRATPLWLHYCLANIREREWKLSDMWLPSPLIKWTCGSFHPLPYSLYCRVPVSVTARTDIIVQWFWNRALLYIMMFFVLHLLGIGKKRM